MLVVQIDVILHATEDVDRVLGAISDVLRVDANKFAITKAEGHYHNPILRALATLRGKRAGDVVRQIRNRLSDEDTEYLSSSLTSSISGSTLYIRLSKQDMIHGDIVLQDSDAVRLRITIPVYNSNQEMVFRTALDIK